MKMITTKQRGLSDQKDISMDQSEAAVRLKRKCNGPMRPQSGQKDCLRDQSEAAVRSERQLSGPIKGSCQVKKTGQWTNQRPLSGQKDSS